MERITNLQGLLTNNLKSLYSSETQQLEELPKILNNANSEELRNVLNEQIGNKKENINRLTEAFNILKVPAEAEKNEVASALLNKCKDVINNSAPGSITDAGLICAVQQLNHQNIAGLGTAASHARTLGFDEVANIIHQSLDSEKKVDDDLSKIAEEKINPLARNQA